MRSVGTWFPPTGRRTADAAALAGARGVPARPAGPGPRGGPRGGGAAGVPAASGVTAVDGAFVAGDPVDLVDENGHTVARGLVNFDATELPPLLGRSTSELAKQLGTAYEREVVHRDDLVVLGRQSDDGGNTA